MPQRPRIGLALGSGSAKGLAHLGVLRVLEQHSIPIDYIAGSSIGAVIGAYYAQNPTINALEELVYKLSERNLTSVLDLSIKGGLIKGNKIETLLRETLKTDSFDSLQIPFAAVATDLTNADSVSFTRGDLIKALRASSAIPGFLRSIEYDGRFLADGGLSNPVPVDVVRAMGADIVIAVNSLANSEPLD
ncbi:patatin-like phospholipase family protein [Candidatus Microgenomates bacterium]|nr:patatin-like phospholipase family protein [Candidatus Microgenomates bacterium]